MEMAPPWLVKVILAIIIFLMFLGVWKLIGWLMEVFKIGGVSNLRLVLSLTM
jgi:hypothetical protein